MSTLPSSAEVTALILPGVRAAARERYGRLKMVFLGPLLFVLVRVAAEFLLDWLRGWIAGVGPLSGVTVVALAEQWAADRLPEVSHGMANPED